MGIVPSNGKHRHLSIVLLVLTQLGSLGHISTKSLLTAFYTGSAWSNGAASCDGDPLPTAPDALEVLPFNCCNSTLNASRGRRFLLARSLTNAPVTTMST